MCSVLARIPTSSSRPRVAPSRRHSTSLSRIAHMVCCCCASARSIGQRPSSSSRPCLKGGTMFSLVLSYRPPVQPYVDAYINPPSPHDLYYNSYTHISLSFLSLPTTPQ